MNTGLMLIKCVDLILQNAVSEKYEKFKETLRKNKEQQNFKNKLLNFCDKFIEKHPNEIVATSYFANYLEHYNVIEHILDYYYSPSDREQDFFDKLSTTAKEIIGKNYRINPIDRSIEEFHWGLYEFVDRYFQDKIPSESMAQFHVLMQNKIALENRERALIPTKPIVKKKTYPLDWDPIPRKFFQQNNVDHDQTFCRDNLFEICQNEKHVVLLDTAGAGKSVELQRVAAIASSSENDTYPILFNLRSHVEQSIEEIIHETYPEINYQQLFLIIDAYDEVLPQKSLELARSVNSFVLKHPETTILISSRSNFCQIGDARGKGATFDNFKVYGLVPLSNEDINAYVESKGIQTDHFWNVINTNSIDDLILIPFYLSHICKLMQKNVVISGKSQLMDQIVCSLFAHDLEKFVNTVQLDEQRERILWQLGKLAFAMQSMHQKSLSDTDYQLLMGANPFPLIKYSGLFKKTPIRHGSLNTISSVNI